MNILAIDASTEFEIVGVKTSRGVFDRTRRVERSHSVTLFNTIAAALTDAGITINEIDLIAAGIGPGSFTGIRIAVATVRALAQAISLPVAGIISQEIFAASADSRPGDNIISAFDAKKGRVFGALYRAGIGRFCLEVIIPPGDYHAEYLARGADKNASLHLVGSGCEKYFNEIKNVARHAELVNGFVPSGAAAAELAEKIFQEGDGKLQYEKILPLYSRRSDAEIALEERRYSGN